MDELRVLFPDAEPTVIIRELVRTCIQNKRAEGLQPKLDELKVAINV